MISPGPQSDAGSLVRRAAILYCSMAVVALIWNGLRGRGMPLFSDSDLIGVGGYGVLTGVATFGLGLALYRFLPAMREITQEMSALLVASTGRGALVALAFLSGIGEEMLFRGAIQAEFGIIVASIIFGLLHIGPSPKYLLWTIWAVGGGFLYGGLYEVTGGILAPMIAHVLHNAVTLLYWKTHLRAGQTKEKSL